MHSLAYHPGGPDWRWLSSAAVVAVPFAWFDLDPLTVLAATGIGIAVYLWLTKGKQ